MRQLTESEILKANPHLNRFGLERIRTERTRLREAGFVPPVKGYDLETEHSKRAREYLGSLNVELA